ncbi:MAG: DUF4294 domain-containing protein [Luteibaculaceae bacterium]
MEKVVIDGDTILLHTYKEIHVFGKLTKREQRKYDRTTRYTIQMYPYAKLASELMVQYNKELSNLPTEKARKIYLKRVEDELKNEFEGEIRRMTLTQGKILLKLIDREVGNTGYDLIKEFRGSFSAFFWQSVAKLFGSDLRVDFDPKNSQEDLWIDLIAREIESGSIKVGHREAKTLEAKAVLKQSRKGRKILNKQ